MKGRHRTIVAAFGFGLALAAISAGAHHGSAISYDTQNLWTTWATVTQFNYANPHPTMTFDRLVRGDDVEHWVSELLTNPSTMARQGWTRQRTLDALAPGTRVKLTIGTSRAGGFSGIVMRIENESGEAVAGGPGGPGGSGGPAGPGGPGALDLDGVPGGKQPTGDRPLPGQEQAR